MKVRVVLTLDVDPECWKERYPYTTQRLGGVREAVRDYVLEAVRMQDAIYSEAIRSDNLATEKPQEV